MLLDNSHMRPMATDNLITHRADRGPLHITFP